MFNFGVDIGSAQDDWNNDFGPKGSTAENDRRWMNDFNWKQSLRNEELQNEQFKFNKELALHGIKMRADDAIAAGFHPLVGAGVNPSGGSSGGFGGTSFIGGDSPRRGSSGGSSIGFSQDIGRAKVATMTQDEKILRAAQLAEIQANTAESMARKALAEREMSMLGATPPIPSKYNQFRDENGNVVNRLNPEYRMGNDFFSNWSDSLRHNFAGPDTQPFWGAVRRGFRRSLFLD